MYRKLIACGVTLFLSVVSVSAQSASVDQKRVERTAKFLTTVAHGTHVRVKLVNGRKLEGSLVEKSAQAIVVNIENRPAGSSLESMNISEIRELKIGDGFGRRFKERMATMAFVAIVIPTFAIHKLLGKAPCLGFCD